MFESLYSRWIEFKIWRQKSRSNQMLLEPRKWEEWVADWSFNWLFIYDSTMFNCTFRFSCQGSQPISPLFLWKGTRIDSQLRVGSNVTTGSIPNRWRLAPTFLFLFTNTRAHFKNSSDKKLKHISLFLIKIKDLREITVTYSIHTATPSTGFWSRKKGNGISNWRSKEKLFCNCDTSPIK